VVKLKIRHETEYNRPKCVQRMHINSLKRIMVSSISLTTLPLHVRHTATVLIRHLHVLEPLLGALLRIVRRVRVVQRSLQRWMSAYVSQIPVSGLNTLRPPATLLGFLSPPDLDAASTSPPFSALSRTSRECCLDSSDVSVGGQSRKLHSVRSRHTGVVEVRLVAADDVSGVGRHIARR
jgi:hypothetical protein